jgi:hypothetical protein
VAPREKDGTSPATTIIVTTAATPDEQHLNIVLKPLLPLRHWRS